jgi:UTP--glucose-1-phosphate uridylyltransferase
VCLDTGGSVVGLKQVPRDEVSAYGVIDPGARSTTTAWCRCAASSRSRRWPSAPSDLIIIGRYVLTPDVFDEIAASRPGAGGELQLTDALLAQALRAPFHGVLSRIARYDTGNPLGFSTAAIEIASATPISAPVSATSSPPSSR